MSKQLVNKQTLLSNTRTKQSNARHNDRPTQDVQVQRAVQNPSLQTLTPDVITQLQQTHGNQYVTRLIQTTRANTISQPTIQRDDEPTTVDNAASLGDLGGALVEVYKAFNGDDSANAIAAAIGELSGGYADTKGGGQDAYENSSNLQSPTSAEGIGAWSKLAGGVTSAIGKGASFGLGALSAMGSMGASALGAVKDYAGYGNETTEYIGEASTWIGGWAKNAGEAIEPYMFYVDMVAAGSKSVSGITEGWSAGTAMVDLTNLEQKTSNAGLKTAAKMLFNAAWWKRLQGYGQGAVGAIEGGATGAAIWFGPLSKALPILLTKSYESGWGLYLLRKIFGGYAGISTTATAKAQEDQAMQDLNNTIPEIVANGKLDDIASLCAAADMIGMDDFIRSVWEAFDNPPNPRSATAYAERKRGFKTRADRKGFGGKL